MPLHLNYYGLNVIHWLVDASYGINYALKGYTGAKISLGKESIFGISEKQKKNTIINTQGKVFIFYNTSPQMIWNQYLFSNQILDNSQVHPLSGQQ